jgi:hypothetical protein
MGGEFRFAAPRIFAGVDVYNGGETDATLAIRSDEAGDASWTIKPKELIRIRTGWRTPSSTVTFNVTNNNAVRFDNLAYSQP